MARGDVGYTVSNVGGEVEILNRKEFEAVPMTINFGAVTTPIPAGTPIKADGTTVAATPWTGAIGILLHDVDPDYPTGAVLKKAYINATKAQANSNLTYDAALTTALNAAGCRIVME